MATTTSASTPPPLRGAGFAEIKPDNPAAIRDGLNQLRSYLRQSEAAQGAAGSTSRPAWMIGSEPKRESVWLITYLPWPNTTAPSHLRVFAYEVNRDRLLLRDPKNIYKDPKKDRLPPTKDLVKPRRELLPMVVLPPTIPFPSPSRPDMFGLAVESLVREKFGLEYKRANYRGRLPGRRGPDVLWRELEDLFRELADETGDTYWREVADELSYGV
ncbi:MAG: hypothetical protein ABWY04_08545 [Arthrobacter sp.]